MRAWPTILGILAALSLLAACGTAGDGGGNGDDGHGGPNGDQDVGFVVVDETDASGETEVNAGGGFWRLEGTVPDGYYDDVWGDLVGTCEVYTLDAEDPFADAPVPEGVEVSYLEAGDELTVTENGSSYLTAERYEATFDGDTFIGYSSDEAVSGEIAGDLALTVPGDEFPSVDDAAFPDAPAFELTGPSDPGATGSVDESTTFTWTNATDRDDTVVQIELASSDSGTFVSCYAEDTGSFELPSETVSELGGSFSGNVMSAGRQGTRVEAVGDARLIVGLMRAESYALF